MSKLAVLLARWFRHAQRMFHILIALAFLFLAAASAYVSFGEWSYYRQVPSTGLLRFGLLVGFTVFLIILCLYTLGKARSVR